MREDIFGGFFNNVFTASSVPKKHSLEHPECCIRCTSTCGRFRVWLHLRHRVTVCRPCVHYIWGDDYLGSYLAAWRADRVLYSSCTAAVPLVFTMMTLYCAYLRKILTLGGEAGSRNSVQYSGHIELCALL